MNSLSPAVRNLVELALLEDIGTGDVTSRCFVPADATTTADVKARESMVVAGAELAQTIFQMIDPSLEVVSWITDGGNAECGDRLMRVTGSTRSILTAERTVLNFLQRLSGVATLTRRYVQAIEGTEAQLLDTRKTTPGYRQLEKAAVAAGGGRNHRQGLFDMILVKDNHLTAFDTETQAAAALREAKAEHPGIKIEFEADTLEQVAKFAEWPELDFILLDNMPPPMIVQALQHRRPGLAFEASGGINLRTIRGVAETGIDYISVGAVTHSATAVDIGLDIPS